jgi:hypothetical protein
MPDMLAGASAGRQVAEVAAIEANYALWRIIEPHDERENRALSGPAGSDEGVFFPCSMWRVTF